MSYNEEGSLISDISSIFVFGGPMPTEAAYQAQLIKKIERRFPDCFVMKNDPDHIQGIPDLLILFECYWAALEVKKSASEPFQPNQEYYLNLMNNMSFAACIFPENEEEVLDELQSAFFSVR